MKPSSPNSSGQTSARRATSTGTGTKDGHGASPATATKAAAPKTPPVPTPAEASDITPPAVPNEPKARGWLTGITQTVAILGVISLFTDMSSEMIVPLRLIFFVTTLGTPLTIAGLIEGIAEGGTSLLRVVSGRLADRTTNRRGLVIAGYSISNLAKPLLALVGNWPLALGLILVDRSGKSVRGSPRDAMIADSVDAKLRGKAFGFHRSADTLGAAFGPLLAIAVLAATTGNLRAVFGATAIPGVLAILCAVLLLRDPKRSGKAKAPAQKKPEAASDEITEPAPVDGSARRRSWQGLGARFWLFTAIAAIFALGNSSDAFLFLRTEGLEASLIAVPALYFAFNLAYALLATPLGSLSDRFGRLPILIAGYGAFTLVYFGWIQAQATWQVWVLFLVYAVYYAATEGVAKAFISELIPKSKRGTALGWYNGLTGFAALPANIVGAWLWSQFGSGATFAMGAWLGAISFGLLIAWWPWLRPNPRPVPGQIQTAPASTGGR